MVGRATMGGVDVTMAREVLGVASTAAWTDVRGAYLRLVREHHPDGALDGADAGVRTVVTAQVTEAYAVLARAKEVSSHSVPTDGAGVGAVVESVVEPGASDTSDRSDTRRVVLDADQSDAYFALLEAFHVVGVVSYVDRQSAVLETIVTPVPGQATSLLALLEPTGVGQTEVMLGVEPLGSHPPAPLDALVDEIARLLAAPRPPARGFVS